MKSALLIAFTTTLANCSSLIIANDQVPYKNQDNQEQAGSSSLEYLVSDAAITISIKKKLLANNSLKSFNIGVTTTNGNVVLTGMVPDEKTKETAISIASSTKGVAEINNHLVVTNQRSIKMASIDSIITSTIKLSYINDPEITSSSISVKTVNQKVRLTGTVPNMHIKDKVITIAQTTPSVKAVTADIKIDKSSYIRNIASDGAITSMIKIQYLDDDVLSALDIHVRTVNGEVILSGVVENEVERERAILIAKATNGVTKIDSHLRTKKN